MAEGCGVMSRCVLSKPELELLAILVDGFRGGSFGTACDGKHRKVAHSLDKRGLARWVGTNWGSSFWTATEDGIKVHEAARALAK